MSLSPDCDCLETREPSPLNVEQQELIEDISQLIDIKTLQGMGEQDVGDVLSHIIKEFRPAGGW